MTILSLIVWLLILGFVAWLVSIAPIIDATFKNFIKWILVVIGAVMVLMFLLGIVDDGGLIRQIPLK